MKHFVAAQWVRMCYISIIKLPAILSFLFLIYTYFYIYLVFINYNYIGSYIYYIKQVDIKGVMRSKCKKSWICSSCLKLIENILYNNKQ